MKMLVSDFDGTFATSEDDIKINCELLRKYIARGNIFVLSSGRSLKSLKNKVETYNIPYNYLATCDGNFLFDSNDNLIMADVMKHDILDKLEDLKKIKIYDRIDYAYSDNYSSTYYPDREIGSVTAVIRDENITDEFIKEYNKLKNENENYDFLVYGFNGTTFYVAKTKNNNKSTPVKFLERKLKLAIKDIYTVGDNLNDIEMIHDYNGYVIGNNDEVIKHAVAKYNAVHELINDINKRKVLKRW